MELFVPILYCIVALILVRIILIFIPYPSAKNSLSLFWSGFLGLIISLYFSITSNFVDLTIYLPISFAFLTFLGSLSCFISSASPLSLKKNNLPYSSSTPLSKVAPSQERSDQLILSELQKLTPPFFYFFNVSYKKDRKNHSYPFIILGPSGVFHLYPCNWHGDVTFSPSNVIRSAQDKTTDTPDYVLSLSYQDRFLSDLFQKNNLDFSTHSVICLTSPNISPHTDSKNQYLVFSIGELIQNIRNESNFKFSENQVSAIQHCIENNFTYSRK